MNKKIINSLIMMATCLSLSTVAMAMQLQTPAKPGSEKEVWSYKIVLNREQYGPYAVVTSTDSEENLKTSITQLEVDLNEQFYQRKGEFSIVIPKACTANADGKHIFVHTEKDPLAYHTSHNGECNYIVKERYICECKAVSLLPSFEGKHTLTNYQENTNTDECVGMTSSLPIAFE